MPTVSPVVLVVVTLTEPEAVAVMFRIGEGPKFTCAAPDFTKFVRPPPLFRIGVCKAVVPLLENTYSEDPAVVPAV